MKKIFAILLSVTLIAGIMSIVASAESVNECYVSIVDDKGEVVLANAVVPVNDVNGDGTFTIDEALSTAHALYASDDMYASETTQYGLSLTKLWGVENGGGYGYYVNDGMAWSLNDPVAPGDYVNAFIYSDTATYSDTYSFFDLHTAKGLVGGSIEITLCCYEYDASYAPVKTPVKGATITVDGKKTTAVTNADGVAEVEFTERGSHVIGATSDTQTLVTPALSVVIGAVDAINVNVTIADGDKNLVLIQAPVDVSDYNADGEYSIDEALRAAHEQYYEGTDGYASASTEYGTSLTKLWGVENGGAYGYYVNNAMAWSLDDTLCEGDFVNAFVYSDTAYYSDSYAFFDQNVASCAAGGCVTVKLCYISFDPITYEPVNTPLANAAVIINGEATDLVTDENGDVTIGFAAAGTYAVSATSDDVNIVPPVCVVTVTETQMTPVDVPTEPDTPKSPQTGDVLFESVLAVIIALAIISFVIIRRKKEN